jgi:V8-like Glu-specific endopeptidase
VQLDILNHGRGVSLSGAMIDPTHVLTAAHGLYDPTLGLADSVTVIAGRNGQNGEPFGAAQAVRWAVNPGYVSGPFAGQAAYDLAVVTLDQPLGNTTGYLGVNPGVPDSYFLGHGPLAILEYPGDTHSGFNEFVASGPAFDADVNEVHWLLSDLPVEHGASGGPVFVADASGNLYVTAVVSEFTTTEGIGARLTNNKFNWILDQINNSPSGGGGPGTPTAPFTPGVFDPHTGFWYLRNEASAGGADAGIFGYGGRGWLPVVGDWDGDGVPTVGAVSPSATWYLRNSNRPGAPDIQPFTYGSGNWVPVVGDWDGNGTASIGMFDPTTATWYLKNTDTGGAPDIVPFQYGGPGWLPVVGDWNGDGITSIGVVDPSTMTWYLRNSNAPGAPDITPFRYGAPGWLPVVGDWDGNGTQTVGVVNPATEVWYLRDLNSAGAPTVTPFAYGAPGWLPVAGDWNGFLSPTGTQQAALALPTDAVLSAGSGAGQAAAPLAASSGASGQGQAADQALLAAAGGTPGEKKDPPPVIVDSGPVVGDSDGVKVVL